jgi:dihydrodipicolinate synthase/N-acetylneuraminate lyase
MSFLSRRQFLAQAAAVASIRALRSGEAARAFRGIFIIMATPFTESGAVDYEDLEREVAWLDSCGVQGMVWPQLASEYMTLTKEERFHGMEVIARAVKGKQPALVLGVQGPDTADALEYVRQAEKVAPEAIIAIPPTQAKSLDDFREYYRAIARAAHRPLFMQTTGGAKGITPTVEFVLDLARELPNFRYVKEEFEPVIDRMTEFARHRDLFQGVFSGTSGKGMLYEMSLGFDGTMPGAPLADIYAQIWTLYREGHHDQARDLFAKLLLMLNTEQEIPGTRRYMMKKRGVFRTTVSRRDKSVISPAQIKEIEFQFESLHPYLKA